MDTMITKQLKQLKYDITLKGLVTEVLPNNKYQVALLGTTYIIESKSKICKKNDTVYVTIPQNNYNEMFIVNVESSNANNLEKQISELQNQIDELQIQLAQIQTTINNL